MHGTLANWYKHPVQTSQIPSGVVFLLRYVSLVSSCLVRSDWWPFFLLNSYLLAGSVSHLGLGSVACPECFQLGYSMEITAKVSSISKPIRPIRPSELQSNCQTHLCRWKTFWSHIVEHDFFFQVSLRRSGQATCSSGLRSLQVTASPRHHCYSWVLFRPLAVVQIPRSKDMQRCPLLVGGAAFRRREWDWTRHVGRITWLPISISVSLIHQLGFAERTWQRIRNTKMFPEGRWFYDSYCTCVYTCIYIHVYTYVYGHGYGYVYSTCTCTCICICICIYIIFCD